MFDPIRLVLDRLHRPGPITFDDTERFRPEPLAALAASGILVPGETSKTVICEHCEEGCWIQPRIRKLPHGPTLVAPCIGSAEAGLLMFPAGRLATWTVDAAAVARALGTGLALAGDVGGRASGRVWSLGEGRRHGRRRDVYLLTGLGHQDVIDDEVLDAVRGLAPILLVPCAVWSAELPDEVVPLAGVIASSATGLSVDPERFEVRLQPPRPKKSAVKPFPLPVGATWEGLAIEVLDNEHVRIRYGEREETRSYIEFGFQDGRSTSTHPKPSELWTYFLGFAREDGRITWATKGASPKLRDRVRELRTKLGEVFLIAEGTPIADYSESRAYETTFTLRSRRM
ncbi:MAG: hypothetical protein ABMB14_18815 [Myxococcota bacterium]